MRVCQGDILRDVTVTLGLEASNNKNEEELELEYRYYNYAVVLSQDCDLESDYRGREENLGKSANISNDNYLPTILLCPAYLLTDFIDGTHIDSWQMNTELKSVRNQDKIKKNNEFKRYHYVDGNSDFSIPELIIDFKHFISVPRDALYNKHKDIYLATIGELFREELSQRFSNFLSRIGLPILPKGEDCK